MPVPEVTPQEEPDVTPVRIQNEEMEQPAPGPIHKDLWDLADYDSKGHSEEDSALQPWRLRTR